MEKTSTGGNGGNGGQSGSYLCYLCLLLFSFLLGGCSTTHTSGVPNLAVVGPGLFRGGQPTDEGWRELAILGVTNVVKLNEYRENPYAPAIRDDAAIKLGMLVLADEIDFPTQAFLHNQVFLPAEVQLALVFLKDHPRGTFIHCAHGEDRTGLIVACYRMQCGWSKQAAENEMLALGFHKELIGLWSFWQDLKAVAPDGSLAFLPP